MQWLLLLAAVVVVSALKRADEVQTSAARRFVVSCSVPWGRQLREVASHFFLKIWSQGYQDVSTKYPSIIMYPMNVELKRFGSEPHGSPAGSFSPKKPTGQKPVDGHVVPLIGCVSGRTSQGLIGCLAVRQASQCQCLQPSAPCCWSKGRWKHWPLGWNCAWTSLFCWWPHRPGNARSDCPFFSVSSSYAHVFYAF